MPDEIDLDLTADLDGGANDGYLADGASNVPAGSVPSHGDDSKPVNTRDAVIENKPSNLREQLSSAFKGETPATEAVAATEKPAIIKGEDGKYRTADGKFASTEQVAAFEAAAQTPQATPENTQEQPAYLSSMTAVEQEQFKALPAELREYVGRTMEALNTQGSRFSEYDMIEQQLIGPRREAWAANGMAPAVALNQLLGLSDFATRDPGGFVLHFAQQSGLDLDALLDAQEQQNAAIDPNVRALQAQVQQLQSHLQTQSSTQVATQQQENLRLVENFAQEKDGAGGLKRPYLTEVTNEWGAHVQALRAANPTMAPADVLQKAYDNACWANPVVRGKLQEATMQQQRKAEAERAAKARNAASSVSGAPAGTGPSSTNSGNSLRDELAAQFAAARA